METLETRTTIDLNHVRRLMKVAQEAASKAIAEDEKKSDWCTAHARGFELGSLCILRMILDGRFSK